MRIVSQDGKWDLPLESSVLCFVSGKQNDEMQYRIDASFRGNAYSMAKYDTIEKRNEDMQRMRDAMYNGAVWYRFGQGGQCGQD